MSKFVILLIVFIAVVCSALSALPSDLKRSDLPSGKQCAAGSSWKSQCNDCKCTNNGHPLCTLVECTGSEPEPIRNCAPDTMWINDCNTCWCSNGVGMCTLMGCLGLTVPKNPDLPSGKECAAGSSWKSQCNDCKCSNEGHALCTRAECTGDEPDPIRECAPNTSWKDDCNTCWCSDGAADCTLMECINFPIPKKSELLSGKDCAPGSYWKSQCNNCMCTDEGEVDCTRVECVGDEPDPIRHCAPDTVWKNDCNTCWCKGEGVVICSRRECVNITNPKKPELPSGKKCAVGSSWKSQCNNCRCSNDGYALCTYVECTGYEHEPERECAPDTRWKDDCNTCWCDNGTAACTRKGCINITGGSVAAAILG